MLAHYWEVVLDILYICGSKILCLVSLAVPSVAFLAILLVLLVKRLRTKLLESVLYLGIASGIALILVIYSCTGYFLYYAWIRISSAVSYILETTPLVIAVAVVAALRRLRTVDGLLVSLVLAFLIVPATLWLELAISVNYLYPKYVEEMRARYGVHCSLDTAWAAALEYSRSFHNTYGKLEPKPQMYELIPEGMLDPFEAVVRTGACEDFARGLARLLRDSLGCETRVVAFKTENHAFPEVMVNRTWYVFDLTYTTRDKPVKADEYAEYLHTLCVMGNKHFCNLYNAGFDGLIDATGKDLRAEHGFSTNSN